MSRRHSITELNDLLRETFITGKVILTEGIAALSDEDQEAVLTKVRSYSDFHEGNDPYGEHDFGAFDHDTVGKVIWKIDYYAPDMLHGSEDPADPSKTRRVLTIMLAHEY